MSSFSSGLRPHAYLGEIPLSYPELNQAEFLTESELADSIRSLEWFLRRRAAHLKDADGSLHTQLAKIVQATKQWVHDYHPSNEDVQDICSEVFIVDCPELHAVSKQLVDNHLRNRDFEGLEVRPYIFPYIVLAPYLCPLSRPAVQCEDCAS